MPYDLQAAPGTGIVCVVSNSVSTRRAAMCLANGTRHRDDPKSARVYIILEGFGLLQGCFIMCHMPCVYNHFIIALQFHAYTQGRNAHSFTRTHPQAHSHSHPHKQTNKQTRAAARKECTHTHTHPHSHTHTHTHTHTRAAAAAAVLGGRRG